MIEKSERFVQREGWPEGQADEWNSINDAWYRDRLKLKARFWMLAVLAFSALSVLSAILDWPWPVGAITALLSIVCLAREMFLLGQRSAR